MIRHAILWTAPAIGDLAGIRAWIAMDDGMVADRIAMAIKDSADKLELLPNRGRPGRAVGTRELVLAGWPWIVVYEVGDGQVTILRVLHGRSLA